MPWRGESLKILRHQRFRLADRDRLRDGAFTHSAPNQIGVVEEKATRVRGIVRMLSEVDPTAFAPNTLAEVVSVGRDHRRSPVWGRGEADRLSWIPALVIGPIVT